MKKEKAGFLGVFLLLILVALVFFRFKTGEIGNGEDNSYETYSRHYVMITGGEDGDLWDTVYESALEEGKRRGVYIERFGDNLAVEYDRNELVEIAVQASVDGIIMAGDEEETTVALIDKAIEAGIPVVTVLRDCTGSRRQCFVGNNSYNIGMEYGNRILKLLDEDKNLYGSADSGEPKDVSGEKIYRVLVLVDESRTDTCQNLILLGIRETLERQLGKEHSVVVDTAPVDNTRNFSSEESIRDIFLDSEEMPDIMVCLNAVYTQCAYQAAVDYNKVGKVRILGFYDSESILDAVGKEVIDSTITLNTQQMGKSCVEALEEYVLTGYTNGYITVDAGLVTSEEALTLLSEE